MEPKLSDGGGIQSVITRVAEMLGRDEYLPTTESSRPIRRPITTSLQRLHEAQCVGVAVAARQHARHLGAGDFRLDQERAVADMQEVAHARSLRLARDPQR